MSARCLHVRRLTYLWLTAAAILGQSSAHLPQQSSLCFLPVLVRAARPESGLDFAPSKEYKHTLEVLNDGHFIASRDSAVHERQPRRHAFPQVSFNKSASLTVIHAVPVINHGADITDLGSQLGADSARSVPSGSGSISCSVDLFAPSEVCPTDCPFAAELEHQFCHFMCVQKQECGQNGSNVEATIPDEELHQCRRCVVEGCAHCVAGQPGEDIERCRECMPGYFLTSGGECGSIGDYVIGALVFITIIFIIIGIIWYVVLLLRPVVNQEGVAQGTSARERSGVLQRNREQYPLTTNLCTVNVAGAGAIAIFRFQGALLIWLALLLLIWLILGLVVSTDIFIIGILKARTPQEFCSVIKWGRHRQMELVWVKCLWLGIVYLLSLVGSLIYAYHDRRLFLLTDRHVTMSDFAVSCSGLPELKGDTFVEDQIKQALENQLGDRIVGVSCCWNFHRHANDVKTALEADLGSLEGSSAAAHRRMTARGSVVLGAVTGDMLTPQEVEQSNTFARMCRAVGKATLLAWGVSLETGEDHKHDKQDIEEDILIEMKTTDTAYIVFETAGSRDRALAASKTQELKLEDAALRMEAVKHEPEAVLWEEFAVGEMDHIVKVAKAYVITFSTSLIWTVLLYVPYAHYMASFSYANGDKPGEISEGIFVGLVTAGNLFICMAARLFISKAGYRLLDDEESAYTGLYTFALLLNLLLDMGLTSYLSYRQMVGVGVHTADGRLLSDLTSLQQIFESYPMQKSLGNMLFKYCWPATFFLPFAAEPICLAWFPFHVGCLLVRSERRLVGKLAEQALALPVMEQTRYGDLTFNLVLVCCIPFIAPAYVLPTFGALAFSHSFIYLYDHWKVLRGVVRFHYSASSVSEKAQSLFAIPTGMFLSALIFKLNQWSGDEKQLGSGILQGRALGAALLSALILHTVVHIFLLNVLVPWLALRSMELESLSGETYEDCAGHTPCTWFSANPVHCLRSKHIRKDSPPQRFYVVGKENLLQKNPSIGAHYDPIVAKKWASGMEQTPTSAEDSVGTERAAASGTPKQ